MTPDEGTHEELFAYWEPHAARWARMWRRSLHHLCRWADECDSEQIGRIALWRAIDNWDPVKGAGKKYATYLEIRVKNAILDETRRWEGRNRNKCGYHSYHSQIEVEQSVGELDNHDNHYTKPPPYSRPDYGIARYDLELLCRRMIKTNGNSLADIHGVQVTCLVLQGFTNEEIGEQLLLATGTIGFYRQHAKKRLQALAASAK